MSIVAFKGNSSCLADKYTHLDGPFFTKTDCRHLASVPNIIIMKKVFKSQFSASARVFIVLGLLITSACQDDPLREMANHHPLLASSWQLNNTVIINEENGQPAGQEKAFLDEQLFIHENGSWITHKGLSSGQHGEWQQKDFFFVKTEYRLQKLFYRDIFYIEGVQDYRCIHTREKQILTLQSFLELEKLLPQEKICRVHKSFMVNLSMIETLERDRIRIGKKLIPISDTYKDLVYALLGI